MQYKDNAEKAKKILIFSIEKTKAIDKNYTKKDELKIKKQKSIKQSFQSLNIWNTGKTVFFNDVACT